MDISFGMIVFNGNYVLKENLSTIYPFATKIVITEGPVHHYQKFYGLSSSNDGTVKTIKNFPDPDKKIILIQGQWNEKDDMVSAQDKHYVGNFVWHVDSDEIYRPEDIEKVVKYLESHNNCYSMGFRLRSFYGGFDRYISGFEENWDTIRIQRIIAGKSRWKTHRPPTMIWPPTGKTCKEMGHIGFMETDKWGIRIYHYSHVFPKQVKAKMEYYKQRDPGGIIGNYWDRLFVPWMRAKTEAEKLQIEKPTLGVQEWLPQRRGPAFTASFSGQHPEAIQKSMLQLKQRIESECKELKI